MREDHLIEPWWRVLTEAVPGVPLFDTHTHTGSTDTDGFHSTVAELLEALGLIGARAAFFPFYVPDGAYGPENDRVIAEAAASGGRLVPFCRVNPHDADAVREVERCLDAGAAGLKLHPRAEAFALGDARMDGLLAVANERSLPVLIHAGRGIPALGRHALERCEQFPGASLILAHAGISDLAWIWREAEGHPNLYFDTSWWSAADLLALLALVPPGQVLFGSDAPYGTPLIGALLTLRCALAVGLTRDQIASVMGGQAERLIAREPPLDAGPAPGRRESGRDVLLDRVSTFLDSGIGRLFAGDSADESVALARLACDVPDDDPSAAVCASIRSLLESYEEARDGASPDVQFPGSHVILIAALLARTPEQPLP